MDLHICCNRVATEPNKNVGIGHSNDNITDLREILLKRVEIHSRRDRTRLHPTNQIFGNTSESDEPVDSQGRTR